jgi:urease accessory protein
VATQACERVYRSTSGSAVLRTALRVEGGGALDYLPQPTILFDGAHLTRETVAEVGADGRLLAVEAGILGRTAMNEELRTGALRDSWRLVRDGRLVFADALVIADETMPEVRAPWMLGEARAYATLMYVAPDCQARLDELRVLLAEATAGASCWNGALVARLLAANGYELMRTLTHVLRGFRGCPLPRPWSL